MALKCKGWSHSLCRGLLGIYLTVLATQDLEVSNTAQAVLCQLYTVVSQDLQAGTPRPPAWPQLEENSMTPFLFVFFMALEHRVEGSAKSSAHVG